MKPGNVWIRSLSGLFGECHRLPTSSPSQRTGWGLGRLNVTFEVAASAKSGSWFGWPRCWPRCRRSSVTVRGSGPPGYGGDTGWRPPQRMRARALRRVGSIPAAHRCPRGVDLPIGARRTGILSGPANLDDPSAVRPDSHCNFVGVSPRWRGRLGTHDRCSRVVVPGSVCPGIGSTSANGDGYERRRDGHSDRRRYFRAAGGCDGRVWGR